jgi:fumarate hydratase class II
MPRPLPAGVHAMATDKKSCAIYNKSNGEMSAAVADDIVKAADEVVADGLDDHSTPPWLLSTRQEVELKQYECQ